MRRPFGAAIVAVLLLAVAVAAYAAGGGLDPNFSGGGKVTTDLSARGDFAAAVAVQTDGKIVVAGSAAYDTTDPKWALTRYKADGTIDTSFGGGDGKVITNFTSGEDAVYGLAIQSDGKIVAAGDAATKASRHSTFPIVLVLLAGMVLLSLSCCRSGSRAARRARTPSRAAAAHDRRGLPSLARRVPFPAA